MTRRLSLPALAVYLAGYLLLNLTLAGCQWVAKTPNRARLAAEARSLAQEAAALDEIERTIGAQPATSPAYQEYSRRVDAYNARLTAAHVAARRVFRVWLLKP